MKHLHLYEKFLSLIRGGVHMDDIETEIEACLSDNESFELVKTQVRNHGNNLYSITITEKFPSEIDKETILNLNNGILPHIAKECGADLQDVRVNSLDRRTAHVSFYLQYPN